MSHTGWLVTIPKCFLQLMIFELVAFGTFQMRVKTFDWIAVRWLGWLQMTNDAGLAIWHLRVARWLTRWLTALDHRAIRSLTRVKQIKEHNLYIVTIFWHLMSSLNFLSTIFPLSCNLFHLLFKFKGPVRFILLINTFTFSLSPLILLLFRQRCTLVVSLIFLDVQSWTIIIV